MNDQFLNEILTYPPHVGSNVSPPVLSIIIPTVNERENVAELVRRLDGCLSGIRWEAIFVDDDSSDGTLAVLQEISSKDSRIRYLHRIGRRGLASAVVEGMLSTSSPFLAVIDSDLQHDESRLPLMLKRLQSGDCDIVVGSRYLEQGGLGDWAQDRARISQIATKLAQWILPVPLSDPMSGFFMLTRAALENSVRKLSNQGYKVLLDIILSSRVKLRVQEIPYVFRSRLHGQSKLDLGVVLEYLLLLFDKTFGHIVPARFIFFAAVGGLGVFVHLAILSTLLKAFGISFTISQAAATLGAMTSNFFINNTLTYRDKRLQGFWPLMTGLLSFYAVCALGAMSNVGVASVLFHRNYSWALSAIAGIFVGVVWNYAMTSTFTWRKK